MNSNQIAIIAERIDIVLYSEASEDSYDDVDNSFEMPKIRKNFPESFIWDKFDEYEEENLLEFLILVSLFPVLTHFAFKIVVNITLTLCR